MMHSKGFALIFSLVVALATCLSMVGLCQAQNDLFTNIARTKIRIILNTFPQLRQEIIDGTLGPQNNNQNGFNNGGQNQNGQGLNNNQQPQSLLQNLFNPFRQNGGQSPLDMLNPFGNSNNNGQNQPGLNNNNNNRFGQNGNNQQQGLPNNPTDALNNLNPLNNNNNNNMNNGANPLGNADANSNEIPRIPSSNNLQQQQQQQPSFNAVTAAPTSST